MTLRKDPSPSHLCPHSPGPGLPFQHVGQRPQQRSLWQTRRAIYKASLPHLSAFLTRYKGNPKWLLTLCYLKTQAQ